MTSKTHIQLVTSSLMTWQLLLGLGCTMAWADTAPVAPDSPSTHGAAPTTPTDSGTQTTTPTTSTGSQTATSPADAGAAAASATTAPGAWQLLKPDLEFSVKVPKLVKPKVETQQMSGSEPMTNYTFDIKDGDNGFYVLVLKFPQNAPLDSDGIVRTMMQQKLQGAQDFKPVTINGAKGYECTMVDQQTKNSVRAIGFGTPGFAYLFMAAGPTGPSSEFFDSIKLEGKQPAAWRDLSCPEVQLTAQIPSSAKAMHQADSDGTFTAWIGTVGGMMYMVAYVQKIGPFATADQRTKYLDHMAEGTLADKSAKLDKAFTFQGLPARQYSFEDKEHNPGMAIMCVAKDCGYTFMSGSFANMKFSKPEADKFFNSVKLTAH
jgi:hypothetical protein